MPLSNYIGQYGESLKRLTALGDAQAQPQQMGQADAAGAGPLQGAGPPQGAGPAPQGALPQGPAGAGPQSGPPPAGALGGPQPGGAGPQAGGSAPGGQIGFSDLLNAATTDEKEHMVKQLEDKGVDINKKFGELQSQGYVPDIGKMSRHDKGALLTEFGLRMMAASAQGVDAFQAAGIAGQGLLESIRAKREGDDKEKTRLSERQQDAGLRQSERAADQQGRMDVTNAEGKNRMDVTAADNASRERIAVGEARARLADAKLRAKESKSPMHFTDENGDLKLVDVDGNVTTPTEEVTTTRHVPGARGTGFDVTEKKRKPLRPAQKAAPGGLDQDKVQTLIQQEKTRLGNDDAVARTLHGKSAEEKDKYLEDLARSNIMGRPGMSTPTDAPGSDPADMRGQ